MHLLPAPLSRLMGSRALLSRLRAFRSLFDRTPGESDALNGLRAISILLIFGLHVYGPGGSLLGWPPLVDRLVRNLTSSLDLFFVLSGFLVYGRLVRNFDLPAHASNAGSESKGNRSTWTILATYLRGRVLRIVPAYYAALIGSLWFLLDLRSHSARSGMLDAVERVNRALSSGWSDVFFVSNYLPDRLLDAGWSLSVEVQYYISLLLLVPFLVRLSRGWRLVVLAVLYLVPLFFRFYSELVRPDPLAYFHTHTRFDSIVAGMVASEVLAAVGMERLRSPGLRWMGGALIAAFLMGGHLLPLGGIAHGTVRYSLFNAGFAGLLLLSLPTGTWLSRTLSNAPLRFVARISYSMYLWHSLLATVALRNSPWHSPRGLFVWTLSVGLLLTVAGATVLYLGIEEPFHRMARRVSRPGSPPESSPPPRSAPCVESAPPAQPRQARSWVRQNRR